MKSKTIADKHKVTRAYVWQIATGKKTTSNHYLAKAIAQETGKPPEIYIHPKKEYVLKALKRISR